MLYLTGVEAHVRVELSLVELVLSFTLGGLEVLLVAVLIDGGGTNVGVARHVDDVVRRMNGLFVNGGSEYVVKFSEICRLWKEDFASYERCRLFLLLKLSEQ